MPGWCGQHTQHPKFYPDKQASALLSLGRALGTAISRMLLPHPSPVVSCGWQVFVEGLCFAPRGGRVAK